jgi:hypothetical protein
MHAHPQTLPKPTDTGSPADEEVGPVVDVVTATQLSDYLAHDLQLYDRFSTNWRQFVQFEIHRFGGTSSYLTKEQFCGRAFRRWNRLSMLQPDPGAPPRELKPRQLLGEGTPVGNTPANVDDTAGGHHGGGGDDGIDEDHDDEDDDNDPDDEADDDVQDERSIDKLVASAGTDVDESEDFSDDNSDDNM